MMHDPSHPGEVIKHDCIEALQLTVTDSADGLCVSRKGAVRATSRVCAGYGDQA